MSAKWTMMVANSFAPLWFLISVALKMPVTDTALPFWQQFEFSNKHILVSSVAIQRSPHIYILT